jgi:hypothetical protein
VLVVFAAVALGYFLGFGWIEHRRQRNGPWQVTFRTDFGQPTLVVHQPELQLTNITIRFAGITSPARAAQTIRFEPGRPVPCDLPFGRCVFLDVLFLPGTVVCQVFGHEIQLMPRTLTIDGAERPWQSGEIIELPGSGQSLSAPDQPR